MHFLVGFKSTLFLLETDDSFGVLSCLAVSIVLHVYCIAYSSGRYVSPALKLNHSFQWKWKWKYLLYNPA